MYIREFFTARAHSNSNDRSSSICNQHPAKIKGEDTSSTNAHSAHMRQMSSCGLAFSAQTSGFFETPRSGKFFFTFLSLV